MAIRKITFFIISLVLLIGLTLNQFARIQSNSLVVSLLDICVFIFFVTNIYLLKDFKKNNLYKPILIFSLVTLLSLIVNYFNFTKSELLIGSLYFIRWNVYAFLFFEISQFKKFEQKITFNILFFSSVLILIIGLFQYKYYDNLRNLFYLGWDIHLYRLFSTFLDPNFAGAFFTLFSLLTGQLTFESLRSGSKIRSVIFLYLTLICFIATFLTYSRSALAMFIFSWVVLLILNKQLKLIVGLILILVIYFAVASSKFSVEGFNLLRIPSSEARIETYQNALLIFKDHPITGIGFNTYRYAQVKYKTRNKLNAIINSSHADAGVDNSFLFILVTSGVIGLISYLYLLFKLFKFLFMKYKQRKSVFTLVAISSLFGLIVNSMFINSLFYPTFMLWMWACIGLTDYM